MKTQPKQKYLVQVYHPDIYADGFWQRFFSNKDMALGEYARCLEHYAKGGEVKLYQLKEVKV